MIYVEALQVYWLRYETVKFIFKQISATPYTLFLKTPLTTPLQLIQTVSSLGQGLWSVYYRSHTTQHSA